MNPHNPFGGILWSLNRISTKEGFFIREGKQCQACQNEVQKSMHFHSTARYGFLEHPWIKYG